MLDISANLSNEKQTLQIATNMLTLAGALLVEAAFGYPSWLFRVIGHPVVWIGTLLGWLDQRMNDDHMPDLRRRRRGVLALALIVGVAVVPTATLQVAAVGAPAVFATIICASSLLAQRSLFAHVLSVADKLENTGLPGGRAAVAHIVGRNSQTLDEAAVARAAIESLAENFSDAVVAPSLWCALLGLPGMAVYKTINTADSMVGHRTPRHAAFGWASARLDDLVNLPASRLASLWLILAASLHPQACGRAACRTVLRDARQHRSPNAGWPEAAMAGALGLRLAGPRVYGTTLIDDAWMGDGRTTADTLDLRRALSLYRLACTLQIIAVVVLAAIVRG
jgi:adenosylcobinamide-phosphate synthase